MIRRTLLIVMGALEAVTGVALMASPSIVALLLLGSPLDMPAATTVGRVAGAGLTSLGVACWCARNDKTSHATTGLTGAMLLYNVATVVVLAYAGLAEGLSGVGLWPAVFAHVALGIWCAGSLGAGEVGRTGGA